MNCWEEMGCGYEWGGDGATLLSYTNVEKLYCLRPLRLEMLRRRVEKRRPCRPNDNDMTLNITWILKYWMFLCGELMAGIFRGSREPGEKPESVT